MRLEEHVEIKGNKLFVQCIQAYSGKPFIVFLHDSLGCIQLWRDFPEKLGQATECNILVYDRLGYGNSDPMPTHKRPINYLENEADILNELLIKLNIENAILFGHSDGGSISLIMASKYSNRIKAIICEAAHIFVEDITLNGIYNAMEAFKTTNLRERLIKYHGGDKVDSVFKAWTETWTMEEYKNWNIEPFLPTIKCPTLVIQGEQDEYGTIKQVDGIINQISGIAKKILLPNIKHTPHKETPEFILKIASEFISNLIDG